MFDWEQTVKGYTGRDTPFVSSRNQGKEIFLHRSSARVVPRGLRLIAVLFLIAFMALGISLSVTVDNTGISLIGPAAIVGAGTNGVVIVLLVLALVAIMSTAAPNPRSSAWSPPPLARTNGSNVWRFVVGAFSVNQPAVWSALSGRNVVGDNTGNPRTARNVASRIASNTAVHAFSSSPSPNNTASVTVVPTLRTLNGSYLVSPPNGVFGVLAPRK